MNTTSRIPRRRNRRARSQWYGYKPLRLESLEDRALLSAGVREEYLLELINQMRTDPVDELPLLLNSTDPNVQNALTFFNVNTTLLAQQWATLTAAPPLDYNDILASTALSHSNLMSQDDQQSHQLPGESDLLTRVQAAGYNVSLVGENIYAYAAETFDAHAAFAIDWGNGPGGMETPPGHRQNIMDATFRDVGLGIIDGGGAGKSTGPVLVTEDFGAQQNPGNPYLVGAVFTGTAYGLSGEGTAQQTSNGLANITVTAVSTTDAAMSFSTTTTAAGGYQLQLPADSYTVTFSGSGLAANVVKTVTVGADNVLLNIASPAIVLPTSSVAALPTTSPASFTVSWSGSDTNGPGIATYDVFVSDNGGPFTAFQTATAATSATFNGVNGHTYGFYSVATDTSGNRQPTPTAAQATTTVSTSSPLKLVEDTYVIGSGTISVAAANGVLANDTGPTQLTVTSVTVTGAEGGTFTFNADGSFTYTPPANFPGFDYAKYAVQDLSGDSGTATVNVLSQTGGIVWKFYEQVLDRDPDYGGLQFWITDFAQGGKPGDIAAEFFESTELLTRIIDGFYEQYLGRAADPGGLDFWIAKWRQLGGPEQIIASFASSPEFNLLADAQYNGDAEPWLEALYHRVLNRAPDPGALTFWPKQLAGGESEFQVALTFVTSPEAYGNDVTGWFNEYLGRAPTPVEQSPYVQQMLAGLSDRDIEEAIANLAEYSANPPAAPAGTGVRLPDYFR